VKGKVKWFNEAKGYGFIEKEDGSGDVFVHRSALKAEDIKRLVEGTAVHFEIKTGTKGDYAANISIL